MDEPEAPQPQGDPGEPVTGEPATTTPGDVTSSNDELAKLKKALDSERQQRREAAKELERIRREEMPAHERAVADAVEAARAEATAEATRRFAPQLVSAELRAAAAGRISDDALAVLTER